jgi:predicted acylesterase/phospholipase RssA
MLAAIEDVFDKRTRDLVHFVAGTSTGAVLAGGVAAGIDAEKMLGLYVDRANEVFPQRFLLNDLKQLVLGYMYPTKNLHRVLSEEAGPAANWTINQAPIDILLTAKRITDGMPWYFVKEKPQNSGLTGGLPLVDCVVASSAVPTYFQPWSIKLPDPSQEMLILTDGGVGIEGNPVYIACVEAFEYMDGYETDTTIVISLGTGRFTKSIQVPTWLKPWAMWVVDEMIQSAGEQQTGLAKRFYPKVKMYRIDPDLMKLDPTLKKPIPMDAIKQRHLLKRLGTDFAKTVPWKGILDGTDTTFEVDINRTLPKQYQH